MQNKMYTVEFAPSELEQLLKVLYAQKVIKDDTAIHLIAKINSEVHCQSPLNSNGKKSSSTQGLDLMNSMMLTAAETYYRYRTGAKAELSVEKDLQDNSLPFVSQELPESSRLLMQIAQSLETITTHLDQQNPEPLGFVSPYQHSILYRDVSKGSPWYQVNAKQQWVPIASKTLTCRVKSINLVREKSGVAKVYISVQGDKLYRLQIPCKSVFCKMLMLGLASLSPAQLRSPITIEPVRSSATQSMTCKLYQKGVVLPISTSSTPHWPTVIQQLKQNLQNLGEVPLSTPSFRS